MRNNREILDLIFKTSKKYDAKVFLVGGLVRDLLLVNRLMLTTNRLIDLDIAVENHYEKIGNDLAKKLNARIIRYPSFMTMTLQLKDASHIDIAQTRKETYEHPAILPKVRPATIEEDLKRRDFTINAMAMAITKKRPYPIIDPFNSRKDLKHGVIRILHKQSFVDDPTRIFRAIRFAIRFGFRLEKQTAMLMKKAIKNNLLKLLSSERILYELKMIMLEKKNTKIIKSLQEQGIIKNLFEIKLPGQFFNENIITPPDKKLIYFFSYIPASIWSKYPITKETAQSIVALKNFSKLRTKLIRAKQPSEIYKILTSLPESALEILSCLEKKAIKNKIKAYLVKYSKVKIFATGKTLKDFKIPTGKIYSTILNELFYQKLDGKVQTKQDELKYIKRKTMTCCVGRCERKRSNLELIVMDKSQIASFHSQ